MTSYPVAFQAPFVMPGASTYAMGIDGFNPAIAVPFEPFADYHWVFGSDNGLADLVQGAKVGRNITFEVSAGGSGYSELLGPLAFTVTYSDPSAEDNAPPTGFWIADSSGAIVSAYATSPGSGVSAVTSVACTSAAGTGAALAPTLRPTPTLSSNYVTTATGRSGLLTPMLDSQAGTICAVVKALKSGTPNQVVFGTTPLDNNYQFGSMLFNDRATPTYKLLTRTATATPTDAPAGVPHGDWMFVAVSHGLDGTRLVYFGGAAGLAVSYSPTPQVKAVQSNVAYRLRYSLGNAHYLSPSFSAAVSCAELLRVPKACTAAEMASLYNRSKTRMAARGIVVY